MKLYPKNGYLRYILVYKIGKIIQHMFINFFQLGALENFMLGYQKNFLFKCQVTNVYLLNIYLIEKEWISMTTEDEEECIDCYRIRMGEVITKDGRCEKCGKWTASLIKSIP